MLEKYSKYFEQIHNFSTKNNKKNDKPKEINKTNTTMIIAKITKNIMDDNINNFYQCKRCLKKFEIYSNLITAEYICKNCGLVCGQITDTSAEWRYYGNLNNNQNKNPTRCGLPIDELLPKSSLTTKIKYSGSKYIPLIRLHKWHQIHADERSLFTVFKYIDKIVINSNLNKIIITEAKQYYKLLSEKDNKKGTLTRGTVRKAFIAACILVSCKNNNLPMQSLEIAQLFTISKFDITRGYKKFNTLEKNKNIQINKPISCNVNNYIHRFCNELNFTRQMEDYCHILCERFEQLRILQDVNELSLTAGLLYYISVLFYKTNAYREKILKIIYVSIVTLEKVYKLIEKNKKYLLIGLDINQEKNN